MRTQADVTRAFVRQARGAAVGVPVAAEAGACGTWERARGNLCLDSTRQHNPAPPPKSAVGSSRVSVGSLTFDCGPGAGEEQRFMPYVALPRRATPAALGPTLASAPAAPAAPQGARSCDESKREAGTDFFLGDLDFIYNSPSADHCCALCKVMRACSNGGGDAVVSGCLKRPPALCATLHQHPSSGPG